jgi:D-serine deaminase-like pyridoxal phosphate-dependent protein
MSDLSNWYSIGNIDELPSPQLVIFPEHVRFNIRSAVEMVGDLQRLRPHIKTNKTPAMRLISQSGEHGVVELPVGRVVRPGYFFVLPVHACPTVNLYSQVYIVQDRWAYKGWKATAKH